ncbi:unnamed protein product [Bursaphelenchus xylophilus]|uniref:(pine wood nematode) hypothetical protein n=1 Tax=Bursaphelenchus xylophilus TaxID=6326 RepID=A0A1I7RLE8_BURXY|nr:unnamed protein product [Bursaphelenchus xylophilus]CAG9083070.1 unnamed protein product [Bursaphelenchus xylophilus]
MKHRQERTSFSGSVQLESGRKSTMLEYVVIAAVVGIIVYYFMTKADKQIALGYEMNSLKQNEADTAKVVTDRFAAEAGVPKTPTEPETPAPAGSAEAEKHKHRHKHHKHKKNKKSSSKRRKHKKTNPTPDVGSGSGPVAAGAPGAPAPGPAPAV